MNHTLLQQSGKKTLNAIKRSISILIGVVLLIAFVINAIPKDFYHHVFTGNNVANAFIGASIGSISAGNPINSYVIGGELLQQNISLFAVTAFILSWVTVGIIQLPAESMMLGKKFALYRNSISFITSIIIALITVYLLHFFT
ncbi:hypothetical protein GF369_02940 [Candidatus Peregrinibacteria bacterium]|nr:hypothetical protein [Candidatus Peregrinibacteria bacterium]